MVFAAGTRKAVLAVHLTAAVGWIGAAMAYLAVGIAADASSDPETVRGAWIAMELIGWYVAVPLAAVSLVTGCTIGLGTRWGLIRHYWVAISLALTLFAAVVLVLHMPTVSSNADVARRASADEVVAVGGDVLHPAVGTLVLLVTLVLNVYKPRGQTPYGVRKLRTRTDGTDAGDAATLDTP